jgi:hypothetical protein
MESLRSLDHLVLPVSQLDLARDRLTALGFLVAPDALHPFGTENACVFFADGTYLEPLAVSSREACLAAVRDANMFIARDQAFRFRVAQEGFSAFVMKSDDAAADHARFLREGLSGGPMLSFSRPVRRADGSEDVARFHLAFAADLRSPDFFFFACERVNFAGFPAAPDHPNGVRGLKAVVLSEENPSDFQEFLQLAAAGRKTRAHSFGIEVPVGNGMIEVLTPAGLAAFHGIATSRQGRGLRGEGMVLSVASLAATEKCLVDRRVDFVRHGGRLVVPPAAGLGAFIAFEE